MGMTVDETIIQATLLKDGVGKDTYKYEILTSLIDIAKKYQKIEAIVGEPSMLERSYSKFMEIASIVRGYEDGKVD